MTNKNKKIIVVLLFLVFTGLLAYNILHPYKDKPTNSNNTSQLFSDYDNSLSAVSVEDSEAEKQALIEAEWGEKYSGNQLANGAQPYSSLYGKNKKYGSSEIRVTAPTGDDVMVMVKNSNQKVVRHAYIRNNKNYTFHLSPGEYQVYFIFGSDWCPEKEAPNGQKGYFLHSSTSKDYPQYIDANQILEYTLQSVMNGNFQPQGADSEEAF